MRQPLAQTPTTQRTATDASILAIVPAMNEADSIASVVAELQALRRVDVVVIDDGSVDGTAERARTAGAKVVSMPFNVGIGGAVQTGYILARDRGYQIAIQVDGDGQHPADQIDGLLLAMQAQRADIVVGSRFAAGTGYRPSMARSMGIRVLRRLVGWCCKTTLTDTTSGFRAAGPRAITLFADQYPHDYPEVESLVLATRNGLRIVEIPVVMRQRATGKSSITPIRAAYYIVKVVLGVLIQLLRPAQRHRYGRPS